MPHINPTLIAPTQPSGAACPTRAGSALMMGNPEQREAQLTEICLLKTDDLSSLTPLQRVQLSEITRLTLDEVMIGLRNIINQFKQALESKQDPTILKLLAELMEKMGLTAYRTASVLRIEHAVNGGGKDDPRTKAILENLQLALFADDTANQGE